MSSHLANRVNAVHGFKEKNEKKKKNFDLSVWICWWLCGVENKQSQLVRHTFYSILDEFQQSNYSRGYLRKFIILFGVYRWRHVKSHGSLWRTKLKLICCFVLFIALCIEWKSSFIFRSSALILHLLFPAIVSDSKAVKWHLSGAIQIFNRKMRQTKLERKQVDAFVGWRR